MIISEFNWQVIVSIIYLATICTVAAFAIYMVGLKQTEAGESVIYMFIEVVVAFLLAWIILDVVPKTWEIVGAIMIVVAVIIVSIKIQNKESRRFEDVNGEKIVQEETTEIIH
jgi:drug/metabolite transporter (DMT)-like permease